MNGRRRRGERLRASKLPCRGYTLVELVVGMAVSSILLLAMGSTVFMAVPAMPNPQKDPPASVLAGNILNQLAEELGTALSVTQLTATTIAFTVPARGTDTIPERIRYSWSGTPGGPLTRQYNGGTVVTVAPSVNLFALTPSSMSVQETYPGIATESVSASLLVNNSASNGLGDQNVQSNQSLGQYFNPVVGSGVYGWRATSVQFMAKTHSVPGVTLVQVQPGNGTLTPTGTILSQSTLTNAMMSTSYTWQSFSLAQQPRMAPGSAMCLVLQDQTGNTSATVQQNNGAGSLQTNGGGQWSYNAGNALYSQLYGTLTTSSSSQYCNASYLTTLGIQLQLSPAAVIQQTSAAMPNHPELLSTKWELTFNQNPTTVDVNGDGILDWVVDGGGTFNMASLGYLVWTTSGTFLDTAPANNFATTTVVDLSWQNTSMGGNGATFSINALRSSSTCAPLLVYLALQADGTQTLTVNEQIAGGSLQNLITIPGLPSSLVDLHLIIDPVSKGICVNANSVYYGTFPLSLVSTSNSAAFASIGASGSTANFTYARIRVLNQ